MAKFPSADSMQRLSPSGVTNVVRLDNNAAGGLDALGAGLGEMAKRKSDFETSKADIAFVTTQHSYQQKAKEDKDYSTIDERYTSQLTGELGELALNISDPRARADFVNRHKMNIENSRKGIQDIAWRKEVDHEKTNIREGGDQLREVILNGTPEEVRMAKKAYYSGIDSGQLMNYYGEEEASQMKKAWMDDAGLSKIGMLDPRGQLLAIQQPYAKELPSDKIAAIKKRALKALKIQNAKSKVDIIDRKAIEIVDGMMDADLSTEEAMIKFQSIKDKEVRVAVEDRFKKESALKKRAHIETQKEFIDEFGSQLRDGDISFSEIPIGVQDDIDHKTWAFFKDLEAEYAKPSATKSTPEAVFKMTDLVAGEQWDKVQRFVRLPYSVSGLSPDDRMRYYKIGADGNVPKDIDDELNDADAIRSSMALAERNPLDKKYKKEVFMYRGKLAKWRREYQESHNGNSPDDNARQGFIDDLLLKAPVNGWWSDTTTPLGLISTPEAMEEVKEEMKDENPIVWAKLEEHFKDRSPTNAETLRMYNWLVDQPEAEDVEPEALEEPEESLTVDQKLEKQGGIIDSFMEEFK